MDDGDERRGELIADGRAVARSPGKVYSSHRVTYHDRSGSMSGTTDDYTSEYRGIRELIHEHLASVELHGFTHMHPDHKAWARSPSRYEDVAWFRELGLRANTVLSSISTEEHPLAQGISVLEEAFETTPTTLICPGDEWTNRALETALDLQLQFVSSYYLAMRCGDRFCWATHICAPYLDEPGSEWFAPGLPVIGYFQDRDVVENGLDWLADNLDSWRSCGARYLIDFRQLNALLNRPDAVQDKPPDDLPDILRSNEDDAHLDDLTESYEGF